MNNKQSLIALALGYFALVVSASAHRFDAALFSPRDTAETEVEVEIEPSANFIEALSKVIAVSTAEATKLAAEIAAINAQVEAGTLSREEGDDAIETLEAQFENRMENVGSEMEDWGESFGERMEAWGERLEAKLEGNDTVDLDLGVHLKKERKSDKTAFSTFEMRLGHNAFLSSPQLAQVDQSAALNSNTRAWQSTDFTMVIGRKHKIGGPASPVILNWGLGFQMNNFTFKGDERLVKTTDLTTGNSVTTFAALPEFSQVNTNQWTLSYIHVPLMLQLDGSKRGKVDKSITAGIGVYGNLGLGSMTYVRGRDLEEERLIVNTYNNLNTRTFRYGLMGQVGYKSLKVTAQLDAAPLFQQGAFNEDVYIGSIGIGFCW